MKVVQCPKKDLYEKSLKEINKIEFTNREIDIISCLLHNRGEKKIASILSISPRTVSAHIHNIMLKLSYNSREHIIDFIENSGKFAEIKKYYLLLLSDNLFESELVKVSKTLNQKKIFLQVNCTNLTTSALCILKTISQDLLLANVILDFKPGTNQNYDFNIKIFGTHDPSQNSAQDLWIKISYSSDAFLENKQFINGINKLVVTNHNTSISYIDFTSELEYHLSIFDLLAKIIVKDSFKLIHEEFVQKYNSIKNSNGSTKSASDYNQIPLSNSSNKVSISTKILLSLGIFFIVTSCFVLIKISSNLVESKAQKIRSMLPLPNSSILLERNELIQKISQKLSSKDEINTIVLLGSGGLGKTTLARQYAKDKDIPLIWEINCETPDTIMSSLEQLAYFLAKSSEERNELANIQKNENKPDKQAKLVFLLSEKIKQYSDWLIIYDNVKSFQDIERFFQYDPKVWGTGSIIITTTDENIATNIYISEENIINVDELSNKERSQLFKSILGSLNDIDSSKVEVEEFLDNIPSFPLDVSIAAYYIKEENISFDQYLEYLSSHKEKFFSIQKNILENIGNYKKTRYDIITLSMQNIIDSNNDFRDLLLMVCMLNSQDIPKDLLYSYKNKEIAKNFLRELKRFSLIAYENKQNQSSKNFSIHRSTKEITLQYLMSKSFENNEQKLNDMAYAISTYVEKEIEKYDGVKIRYLILHIETFLNNAKKINDLNLADLYKQLGMCYFHMGNYEKAENLFTGSIAKYKKLYGENHIKSAIASARLASVYRNIGNYEKSRDILELSAKIYQKYYGENNIQYAWILVYLSSVYENLGNYSKAESNIKEALKIYKGYYDDDHIKIAWTSAYLGDVYTNLGSHKEALNILQKSLSTYQKYYGEDNAKTAWLSVRVASVYRKLGNYKKSKELFEKSLLIYQKQYGTSSLEVAWCLVHLARAYQNLNKHTKALEILKQGLKIYSNYLPDDHIIIAWAKFHLSDVYRNLKDYKTSLPIIKNSYDLYLLHYGKYHVKTAEILRNIGLLYLDSGDVQNAKNYFEEAKSIFASLKYPEEVQECSEYLTSINIE